MIVTCDFGMDLHSLLILRIVKPDAYAYWEKHQQVGCVTWHPNREPRIEINHGEHLTISEMETIIAEYRRVRKQRGN